MKKFKLLFSLTILLSVITASAQSPFLKSNGTATTSHLIADSIKTTNLSGTGTRLVTTDANGRLSFLPSGTSSQILYGNGLWGDLPSDAWNITGNTGTSAGTNFIGTTDSVDFVIKTNGTERSRIKANGEANFTSLNLTNTATFNENIHVLKQIEVGNSIWLGVVGGTGTNGEIYADNSDLFIQSNSATTYTFNTILNSNSNTGKVGIGNTTPYKKLTVNGDVSFANYNPTNTDPDGYNGIEILGDDKQPTRRGISTDNDPHGDFNFWINSNQGPSTGFNFMNGQSNPAKTLAKVDWAGHLFVYPDIANTNDAIDVISGTTNIFNVKIDGTTIIGVSKLSGVHTDALLQVGGKIAAKEIIVTSPSTWSDFVFDPNYKLKPLTDVETYYKTFKHLEGVPSESDVMKNGIDMAQMNSILLQKIEELTLYSVDLKKENKLLKNENESNRKKYAELEKRVLLLENK